MKNNDEKTKIVYRRIRGRIVPIKVKENPMLNPTQKGIAQIASGAVTAAAGGLTAAIMARKSGVMRLEAKQLFKSSVTRDTAVVKRAFSTFLRGSRRKVGTAIGLAGAALAYAGASKVAKEDGIQLTDNMKTGLVAGAAAIGGYAYFRGMGIRPASALRSTASFLSGKKMPKIPIKTKYGILYGKKK